MVEGNENNQSEPDSGTGTPKRRGSLFGARRGRSRTPERDELSGAIPVTLKSASPLSSPGSATRTSTLPGATGHRSTTRWS